MPCRFTVPPTLALRHHDIVIAAHNGVLAMASEQKHAEVLLADPAVVGVRAKGNHRGASRWLRVHPQVYARAGEGTVAVLPLAFSGRCAISVLYPVILPSPTLTSSRHGRQPLYRVTAVDTGPPVVRWFARALHPIHRKRTTLPCDGHYNDATAMVPAVCGGSGGRGLASWGRMAAGHDYFEWGILDRFSGAAMQKLLIKSDGTGNKPGWYLRHGSVSSMQHKWAVDQWLALDEAPNQLFATRNGCGLCQGTAVIFVN
ncbi:hypothetical protein HU200_005693 [Digitaria exilis]|uniref:Uncharacterized protein n=1 Tax=Digitaria exilis TaxID=1010633 RepID=A0A835FR64_9POAL|nr:hypothetical protein HU200_005693 [Digitaria exilis]